MASQRLYALLEVVAKEVDFIDSEVAQSTCVLLGVFAKDFSEQFAAGDGCDYALVEVSAKAIHIGDQIP